MAHLAADSRQRMRERAPVAMEASIDQGRGGRAAKRSAPLPEEPRRADHAPHGQLIGDTGNTPYLATIQLIGETNQLVKSQMLPVPVSAPQLCYQ